MTDIFTPQNVIQVCVTLISLGGFYGAVKAEMWWIKRTLERHEKILDGIYARNNK